MPSRGGMWGRRLPVGGHVVVAPMADTRRALDPRRARPWIGGRRSVSVAATAADGLRKAEEIAGPAGAVLITGSIFLVGELYLELRRRADARLSA